MFEGVKKTFESQSGKLKSNNQPAIFANITSKLCNTRVSEMMVIGRANFLLFLISILSGGFSTVTGKVTFDMKEMGRLVVKFFKRNSSFFQRCAGVLLKDFFPKLSPFQAADVKSLLRFSL